MANYELRMTNEGVFSLIKKYINLTFVIFNLSLVLAVSASAQPVYTGVFREGAPKNMNFIKQFEQQAGKKPAMIMWYQDWAQEFPKEDAANVVSYGAVPHIVWEPWYWGDHNKIKLNDIVSGKWDGYIRTWAKEVKAFNSPIFLRIAHEFNIEGYPWGLVNNGKDPALYVKAFRHIVDIFKNEGATNVKWVWAPMNYSFPDEPWNAWEKAYPGNSYVDWIGFDGYNWGTTQSWSQWQVLKYMFRDQVRMTRKMWPGKPIMVAEFASADKGGDKAAWIRDIPDYLKSSMRDISAIVWFDVKKEADWRINSTPRSLAAFREIMKDPLFSSSAKGLINATSYNMSANKKIAVAVKAGCALKIDGNLSEWDKTAPIVMKDKSFFKEGLGWKGPTDLSGNIYLMWDERNLYVAAEVNDAISPMNKKQKQDIWNGDAIEMVMGTNPANNSNRTSFGPGDYQVGFGTGDGASNPPSIWCWQRRRSPQDGEISVKKTASPQGYTLEAKVPWEFFKDGFVPSSGTKIGFDIALDDEDRAGEREKQFIWNGDYMFYSDPSVWGVLSFK